MTTEAFRFQRGWTGQGVSWEGRKLRPLLRGGTLGSLSPTPPRCSLSRARIFLKELKSPPFLPPTPLTPHSTLEATGIIAGCSFFSKHMLPSPLLGPHMPSARDAHPGWLSAPLRGPSWPPELLECILLRQLPGASEVPSLRDRQAWVQKPSLFLFLVRSVSN